MIYRFSKDKFNKNAPKNIKKLLKEHLDTLDKLSADFSEEYGYCEYVYNNEDYYLYPIYKEWCDLEEQLSLI